MSVSELQNLFHRTIFRFLQGYSTVLNKELLYCILILEKGFFLLKLCLTTLTCLVFQKNFRINLFKFKKKYSWDFDWKYRRFLSYFGKNEIFIILYLSVHEYSVTLFFQVFFCAIQ